MPRAMENYVSVLEAYLLRLRCSPYQLKRYGLLIRILEKLYPRESALIRNNTCPYCGRTFSKHGIVVHLKSSNSRKPCRKYFYLMLAHVARKYYLVSTYLSSMRPNTTVRLRIGGVTVRIRGRDELRKALLTNDDVLKAFLNMVDPTEEILLL